MKILAAIFFILLFAVSAQAETFCQWTGSASINCIYNVKLGPDGIYRGTVKGEKKNFTEAQANAYDGGYFLAETTVQTFDPATHKQGARIEAKPANRIQWTYEVDPLTAEELAAIAEAANLEAELQSLVASLSYADVATHVNTTFSGLSVAQRNSLIKLYRVVLYLAKR